MTLYRLLSIHNDAKALLLGRLPQRIARRVIYRHAFGAARLLAALLGVAR